MSSQRLKRFASCSFLAQNPADLLRPLGLSEDARNFPLSPKSERAYTRISHEFDALFQALQAEADVNQNMPVRIWPTNELILGRGSLISYIDVLLAVKLLSGL